MKKKDDRAAGFIISLIIFVVFIGVVSFYIGFEEGGKAAVEKNPGLILMATDVLTAGEISRICDIVETGDRRILGIQMIIGDEIQYRIRFKDTKQEDR